MIFPVRRAADTDRGKLIAAVEAKTPPRSRLAREKAPERNAQYVRLSDVFLFRLPIDLLSTAAGRWLGVLSMQRHRHNLEGTCGKAIIAVDGAIRLGILGDV
ncbi:hypothetical protein V5F53_13045 [Xanthobacter sp. V4C-4]|uniref:hypothetical protein n=1 Tax=Xanthobacter cornucopiae TaxID=3119924 RepID=UPI00372BC0A7